MPYGTELILKLSDETLKRLHQAYVKKHPAEDSATDATATLMEAAGDAVDRALKDVHKRLLLERFGNVKDSPDGETLLVKTPEGRREFWPFHIGSYGDEDETGEHVGISIAGRYYPIWVDWRSRHGGGDQIILDAETTQMAEKARAAISVAIPEVANAPLMPITTWY